MKKLALTIMAALAIATPVMADELIKETRGVIDLNSIQYQVNCLSNAATDAAKEFEEHQKRIEALEKKMTHVVEILKLKQENGK